ncbi:uncharacterized protein LOC129602544 [Paramacrobiotus metropolitanus]|uniref:uncharacterized protein LOC129602544 n=1 Tax=Paramacrobiotus metropolitanus TaxID=2943436 RepID=UPI002446406D|nr:uncharacterized protein LOC129602544 [Paramacrobiotus metropolitanus]
MVSVKLCIVLVVCTMLVTVVSAKKKKGQQGAKCKSSADCDTDNGFFCKITGMGSNGEVNGHCEVQLDHRGPKGDPKPSNPERPQTPDSPAPPSPVKTNKNKGKV